VGVCELSCHVELKIFVVRNGFTTQLYLFGSTLLKDFLGQHGIELWVKDFFNVFEQDWNAAANARLEFVDELGVGQLDLLQIVFALHILDPLVALGLRVNH
jgi:hypothetical protein